MVGGSWWSAVSRVMAAVAAIAGTNAILWVFFAPLVVRASPFVGTGWIRLSVLLALVAGTGSMAGAVLPGPGWSTRIQWLPFLCFGGPFGLTSFWLQSEANQTGNPRVRRQQVLILVVTSVGWLAALSWAAGVPLGLNACLRGAVAVGSAFVLFWVTLRGHGRRYWSIWAVLALIVGAKFVIERLEAAA